VGLDLDPPGIEADKSMGDRPCKHVVTIGNGLSRNRDPNVMRAEIR